ncbi:PKD domain-containing protein [bacterium]|nr:PKD domain-containing protein [bacterium]
MPWLTDEARASVPRAGSGVQTRECLGDDCFRCDASAVKNTTAHTLQLFAGADTPAWAIFRFDDMADADTPLSVTVELASPLADAFWLGFGDMTGSSWRWQYIADATGNDTVDVPAGITMINPYGLAYVAVVLWDDATLVARVALDVDIDGEAPVAAFTVDRTFGNAATPVNVDAGDSFDRDAGTIVSYEWDWEGDGVYDLTEADPIADFTYVDPSDNMLTLRVTDNNGNTDIAVRSITVQGWSRTWGTSVYECLDDLWVDSQGNVYTAGYTSLNETDWLVVKYNRFGELQWKLAYGGDNDDRAYAVSGSSGYAYVAGYLGPFGGSSLEQDVGLIKLAPTGEIVWQKRYHFYYFDQARALAVDGTGNIFLAGKAEESWEPAEALVMQLDPTGEVGWAKTWAVIDGSSYVEDIKLTAANQLLLCGGIRTATRGGDVLLLRFTPTGGLTLESCVGQATDDNEYVHALALDYTGNAYLVGSTSGTNPADALLVKYDSSGVYQWAKTIGSDQGEYAMDVFTTGTMFLPVSVFVLGNYSEVGVGNQRDPYIWQLNSSGALNWQRTYTNGADQAVNQMVRGHAGVVAIAGEGVRAAGVWNTGSLSAADYPAAVQTASGTVVDHAINAIDITGTVTVLGSGVENTGGGNNDAFVMSYFTNDM